MENAIILKCKCVGASGDCVGWYLHMKGAFSVEARVAVR